MTRARWEVETVRRNDIVVGVDGSAASWDALHWAVRQAYRWHADLHVVFVDTAAGPPTQRSPDSRLAQMVTDARRLEPSVRIYGHSVSGGVAAALREASTRSRMLVLGNRGTGGFGRLTLGATGQQVATHATVPVVIVRGRQASEESPIVVGVDGSAGSEAALASALDEARLRGCGVIAVFAYGRPEHPWLSWHGGTDAGALHTCAYTALETAVAPWQDKFPWVGIESVATAEQPLPVLLDLSSHAQLVVVGAHGHDDSAGLVGAVPLKLMHRAHCPVMIVR
jgi:nucleotide-binding universal stress UspA family protein